MTFEERADEGRRPLRADDLGGELHEGADVSRLRPSDFHMPQSTAEKKLPVHAASLDQS